MVRSQELFITTYIRVTSATSSIFFGVLVIETFVEEENPKEVVPIFILRASRNVFENFLKNDRRIKDFINS